MQQAQQQQPDDSQMKAAHELVQGFINYSVDHPHVMLGTYLQSAAIIAGLAMRMCDIERQHIEDALEAMRQTTLEAYGQASANIQPATIQ